MRIVICALAALVAAQLCPAQAKKNPDILKNLRFRNLGPAAAGGRVSSVVGVPGNPDIYYVGAAAGGVFKSTDGGITWKAIFQKEPVASIGSIALAPSNPNLVWVGTGESKPRNDVIDGAGVYFSPDAGHSWKFMGLRDAGQISRVMVSPQNPKVVFVAALGNVWKPNAERGVFRTEDGGKTWKKVLYVDDSTGAADLAMQPGNPEVLFAAMWRFRRYPWTLMNGGDSSGIYRSTDGGATWKKLTKGLPKGPLGRIGLAIAPSNPDHIYALIDAKNGILWQSTDMGDHWTKVSDNHALDVRPFYFSRLAVAPNDENKIYFMSMDLMESDDGGKTAHLADRGVHVDHHAIWIDPRNPKRIIQGNDGGAFLSMNGAKSWRFLDGLPIEQFYQVAKDSEQPFHLCGGLQDNGAWCGPSSDLGRSGVTNADWRLVVGGDGQYAVPAPSDPHLVYTDAQNGWVLRLDKSTHLAPFQRPVLETSEDMPPSKLNYRFNWTAPIAVAPKNPDQVYLGANVLFQSLDGGNTWKAISGDLTRNDKTKQNDSGHPMAHDISGAENYDTILSIAIAPTDPKVIWVGTDDGYVQLTRNAGKTWTNVTSHIPGAPQWARVYKIGASPFDAGTAYVSFDAHMLGDRNAYVYKTSDYGQTWQSIANGLPASPVFVVREDPNQRGFLALGNDHGLFYSSDAGAHWHKWTAHFPTVPVFDLQFDKAMHDLIVATHGRGLFVFDDIRPIEQLTSQIAADDFHVFQGGTGILYHHWQSDEGQPTPFSAPNAPGGVPIDYLLKAKIEPSAEQKAHHQTPVKIVVTDSAGTTVATHYGPSNTGINRFIWDMRYSGTRRLPSAIPPEPPRPGAPPETRFFTRGPLVLPGTYKIAVTVDGKTQTTTAKVEPDPNLHIPESNFREVDEAALQERSEFRALNAMIERLTSLKQQLDHFRHTAEFEPALQQKYTPLFSQAKDLEKKIDSLKATVYNPKIQHNVEEDDIHALTDFHGQLRGEAGDFASRYGQP
ncbi:MAG: WD40/YVTN/BNR-like repeat-containing protein, partial [Bryobacteraceae bacterium]